jgi:hypothetical protein
MVLMLRNASAFRLGRHRFLINMICIWKGSVCKIYYTFNLNEHVQCFLKYQYFCVKICTFHLYEEVFSTF